MIQGPWDHDKANGSFSEEDRHHGKRDLACLWALPVVPYLPASGPFFFPTHLPLALLLSLVTCLWSFPLLYPPVRGLSPRSLPTYSWPLPIPYPPVPSSPSPCILLLASPFFPTRLPWPLPFPHGFSYHLSFRKPVCCLLWPFGLEWAFGLGSVLCVILWSGMTIWARVCPVCYSLVWNEAFWARVSLVCHSLHLFHLKETNMDIAENKRTSTLRLLLCTDHISNSRGLDYLILYPQKTWCPFAKKYLALLKVTWRVNFC